MKALKIILGVLVVLAVVYFALAFAGPSHVHVERAAVIEAPVEIVFPEVNSLKQWTNWDPWHAMDTAIVNTYSGPDAGAGCKNEWKSEIVGVGSQEFTESVENERIVSHLSFDGQGEADATLAFATEGENTRVTWSMDMDIPFTGRPFMLFMNMDKMLGADFEKGLAGLNAHCKALLAANPPIEAAEMNVDPFWVVSITDTTTQAAVNADFEALVGELGGVVAANKVAVAGNLLAFWPMWGDTVVFDVAFPVAAEVKLKKAGRAAVRQVAGGKVVKTTHLGGAESSEATHIAVEKWITRKGLTESGVRWEEYETLADSSAAIHIFVPVN